MRRIRIHGLHGLYNYDYTIPDNQNVSVITGPNGYGKTTILNILNSIFKGDFWYFYYLVFQEIIVDFVGGPFVKIIKVIVSDSESILDSGSLDSSYVRIEFNQGGAIIDSFEIKDSYIRDILRKIREDKFFLKSERSLSQEEWLNSFYKLEEDIYIQNSARNLLLFLSSRDSIYVPAKRTSISFYGHQRPYSVTTISEILKQDFASSQKYFAEVCQKSDATFFNRLMDLNTVEGNTVEDIEKLASKLKQMITDFRRYHLLPEEMMLFNPSGSSDNLPVISLYLKDMEMKMEALSPFYEKVLAFDSFVSGRVLSDKSMHIGPDGIEVVNVKGDIIPLDKLSDGEKNLISIAYNLAYASDNNTLILIDEPENSLHMAWLEGLLPLFVSLAEERENQIIVATHSPAFIDGNWDITYDLFDNSLK